MERIDWVNGKVPINRTNLNGMQDNIEKSCVAVSPTEPTTGENVWIKKGKNEFNKSTAPILNTYVQTSDNTFVGGYAATRSTYIEIEPNTTYTISKQAGQTFRVATSTGIPTHTGSILSTVADHTGTAITITTEANAKYLFLNYYNTDNGDTVGEDVIKNSIQIEENSTATAYEDYIEKEIYVKNENGVWQKFYKEENIESGTITYSNNFSGSGWRPNIVEKCGKMVSLHLCIVSPTSFADNNRQLLAASIPTEFAPKTTRIGQAILDGSSGFGQYFIYQDGNIVVNFEKAGQQVLSLDISYFTD